MKSLKHGILTKDGKRTEEAIALHKDAEKFIKKMYKKYPNMHPYDIGLVIAGGAHAVTTMDVIRKSLNKKKL